VGGSESGDGRGGFGGVAAGDVDGGVTGVEEGGEVEADTSIAACYDVDLGI
jgi:hypothetical protein